MKNCNGCWLRKQIHESLESQDRTHCLFVGKQVFNIDAYCTHCITDEDVEAAQHEECIKKGVTSVEDIEAARNEAERTLFEAKLAIYKEKVDSFAIERSVLIDNYINYIDQVETKRARIRDKEKPLTCSSCSFASKAKFTSSPGGFASLLPLPDGMVYCQKRDTKVPDILKGCHLHSERKKRAESAPDKVNSLDNTIDECFREMKRLINLGLSKNTQTPEQLRENEPAVTKRLRAERDALKVCNRKLSKDNEELRDENKILRQEAALLKSKRKKESGEIASLQVKISQIKKELSGKWRLLEAGEKPQKGDQAFILDSNNVRCWVEYDFPRGAIKEDFTPCRRKINI